MKQEPDKPFGDTSLGDSIGCAILILAVCIGIALITVAGNLAL